MSLRSRLILVFLFSVLTGLGSVVYWVLDELEPRYKEAQEEILVDISEMMATLIANEGVSFSESGGTVIDTHLAERLFAGLAGRPLNAQIYDLLKTEVDLRMYITDARGTVIFDSHYTDTGRDYSQWRDVYLTLRGHYGARSSDDVPGNSDTERLYAASPVLYRGDIIGVVSTGKPTRNINRFISHLSTNLLWISLVAALATLLTGLVITLWITRPLLRLEQYARGVSRGERPVLPALGHNEVGRVGKALESMKAALDGKSYVADYVQSLTHELKAPIAGIRGAAELLQEPMSDARRNQFLNNIIEQGSRMQELIERLLKLAAIEYQSSLERHDKVVLKELITAVCRSLEDYASQHRVSLEYSCDPSLSITGDSTLLQDALSNLIRNAIEFSPTESVVLIGAIQNDASVYISVKDSGPGVPPFAEEKLTQRFFCLPRTDGSKGSGLGLSFVHEIMQLHNGKLNYHRETEPPATVFSLTLPAECSLPNGV